jgi:hypothetical protein
VADPEVEHSRKTSVVLDRLTVPWRDRLIGAFTTNDDAVAESKTVDPDVLRSQKKLAVSSVDSKSVALAVTWKFPGGETGRQLSSSSVCGSRKPGRC